jgi:Ca2+-binding RTX toxin-like protein
MHDPAGATFGGGAQTLTAVGWALDDDGVGGNRAIAVSAPVVQEGLGRTAVFTISLSEAFVTPQSFAFSTFDGSARAGSDYVARAGTVTFAAGQLETTVEIDLINDAAVEAAESFGLRINGAGGVTGTVGRAQILNDDGATPLLSIDGARNLEGEYMAFTVRLSEVATDVVTVQYRTLNGSALVESEVVSWSSNQLAGTLTFAPGEQVKTVYALVSNDNEDEIDENVLLELSNPSRALFAEGARSINAIGWALDDDRVGVNRSVAVSNPVVYEGNQAVFTVELSQASTTPVTLGYQTSSGSARAGADFLSQSGALTFAAGQTRAYVTVDLLSDRVRETSETFNLAITSYPSQISIRSGDVSGLATIVDGTIRGTSGADTLSGTEAIDRIEGLAGDDVLRGYGGDDFLLGDAGDDVLNGGAGNDRMSGGTGDDTYIVSEWRDTVEEARGEGVDTVRSSINGSLGANVENLILSGRGDIDGTGNGLANRITGNGGDNTLSGASGRDLLYGEAGADRLIGGTGNDLLDGASGSDRMSGGTGDDVYVVDRSGDVLYEARDAGTDTVRSGTHWTLGANFENLALTGRRDIDGTGNGLANRIVGNSGDNVLSGGAGADTISAGSGDDSIVGGAQADRMTGGAGADRFVFLSDGDTELGRWRDVITDFAPRTDKLVLSAIDANEIRSGNQAFDFIGRADFSRTAGELRFSDEVLSADTDGDGRSDFEIELAGLSRIYSADVIA